MHRNLMSLFQIAPLTSASQRIAFVRTCRGESQLLRKTWLFPRFLRALDDAVSLFP